MNLFERASRAKLRFQSRRGLMSTEDLWDLSLTSLDEVAKNVNRQLKAASEESFIEEPSNENSVLSLQLELLKHVIASKKSDKERARVAAETRAKKDMIEKIIISKKNQELEGKSVEELQAMLNG